MQKKQYNLDFIIPVVTAAVFAVLNLTAFYNTVEHRIYDLLLHLKPKVPQEKSILFVDIDDLAIEKIGIFPWSRDIMADGLVLMKEFEARYAVFDIEYTEESPLGVNSEILKVEIPQLFNKEFSSLQENISGLFGAIRSGTVSLRDAQSYINDLAGLTDQLKKTLLAKVQEIAKNNDIYLGQAARFFGNSFFTVNMFDVKEEKTPESLKEFVREKVSLKNAEAQYKFPFDFAEMRPAIRPVIEGSRSAGFVNVIVDDDGVRRRIDLINAYKGAYYAQLAFSPLLHWMEYPKVILQNGRILLQGAKLPSGEQKDISIPLAEDGRFLINWPETPFIESFRHISYYELVLHKKLEENLLHNLAIMDEYGFLSLLDEKDLMAPYTYGEQIKREVLEGGDTAKIQDYREARKLFFTGVGRLLNSDADKRIIDYIDQSLESKDVPEEYKAGYRELKTQVPVVFNATREIYKNTMTSREKLSEVLPGSFCILGWIGTSTTDIGVNPFEESFMNVGTHAAVVNTVISGMFLDQFPWWYSAILALVLSVLVTLVIRGMTPLPSIIVGFAFLLVFLAGDAIFFIYTGIYLNLLTPALSLFLTFLLLTIFKFIRTEQERGFLRNAFSHYLSPDVISDLLLDPDKLNLGGEKKFMTAMFTDVRGFSTISEALDPQDLVKLLNIYLSTMSDTILELKGTIDKYEGDAIICFFGAPIELKDHARRACLSAVRMKKLEHVMNERFQAEKMSPNPLVTRIGINTGEMVVGNMGTQQKMDYTIMGNSVNLAARLEGVNKQYGTWVLISESVHEHGAADFTVRQMDRVRVVGIQQPVRLYELIDEKSLTDAKTVEAVDTFHHGQKLFEQKGWEEAKKFFNEVQKLLPGDGPSKVFSDRCTEYMKKAPPDSWDGVFNLTVK